METTTDPQTIARPHEMLAYLRSTPPALLRDEGWLTALLGEHCRFGPRPRGGPLRILQVPNEFARFCIWAAAHEICSYLEIGVSTGGSWLFMDAYLRAANPAYLHSVGYDDQSKLRGFAEYNAAVGGTVEFRHQLSKRADLGRERYGLGFIDANHKDKHVWGDFHRLKDHCRYIAFHDIVWPAADGVQKVWALLKRDYKHYEFIDTTIAAPRGIGVVELK